VTGLLSSVLYPALCGAAGTPESGLGGKLVVRMPPRGGWGNALILMVFLMLLPASFTPGAFRSFGRVALCGDVGRFDVEGARRPLLGRLGAASDLKSESVGMAPVLLRVLVLGKAGRALVGGPRDGLDGRGSDAAMSAEASTG
jgi:hypothetical protein